MKVIKKSAILLCFVLFTLDFAHAHPFYVSICQVNFNPQNEALEVSLKIFADDLLLGLNEKGYSKIYLGEEKENPDTDKILNGYLNEHLKFSVNQLAMDYVFVGKEMEDDVVWIYLEMEQVQELNEMEVECSLLTEVLEGQNNIIQVSKGKQIKNALLNKRKTIALLNFN